MILYHSSYTDIRQPDTKHSRSYLDFGQGFYLTSLHEQAVRYAQRFKRRGQQAWLNTYDLNYDETEWNVRHFETYDKSWLDFVALCREGNTAGDYDMIVGGVANDRVIATLDRYFLGEISQETALGLLKYEKPNVQFCIRSERMIKECLKYIGSEQI